MNPVTLKCYDSEKIVVLQGMFTLDTANEDYLAAEQLEITFTGKGQAGESKQYLYRSFMNFFYVREPIIVPGNDEASD